MQVDPAQAARHPAVAEFVIEQLRNRRAALAQQPQALQHCADAI